MIGPEVGVCNSSKDLHRSQRQGNVTWTISPGGTFKNKYCKLRKGTPQFVLIILRISKKKKKERKDFLGNFLKQNR